MDKELLYTTAFDSENNLISIHNAEKGNDFFCPECKGEFILRKSGKTGKGTKRPHFAHNNLTTNCTPEGVLHFSFKRLSVELLKKLISEKRGLTLKWMCPSCHLPYKANLLQSVQTIEEEYNLKQCQPDIALLDSENKVMGVIEVVVTHEPEENVLKYYQKYGITLIQLNLSSEEDLDRIEEKITNPDIVNLCLNPQCNSFENHVANRKLFLAIQKCKNCFQPLKTCYVQASSVFGNITTTTFTEEEVRIVESKGVKFNVKVDTSSGQKVHSIKCSNCELKSRMAKARYGSRRF